jgi:2-polyprenyl-3-methyl-5-hydroxy-6-metoxy-1,4-benzoquinol methylase
MDYSEAYFKSRNPNREADFHHRLIRILAPLIRPGGRCLEVGAGTGYLTEQLLQDGSRDVVAVDMSEYAVQQLKARCPTAKVVHGDIESSLAIDGVFDTITLIHVLEHTQSPREVLRRVKGWLAPSGVAVIVVPNCGSCWQRWLGDRQWGHNDPSHVSFFTRQSLRALMASVFEETRFFTYPVPGLWMLSPDLARILAFGLGTHLVAVGIKKPEP